MYMAKGNFQSLRELKEKAQTNRYKVQQMAIKSSVFQNTQVQPGAATERNRSANKQRFLNEKICRPKDSIAGVLSYHGNQHVK